MKHFVTRSRTVLFSHDKRQPTNGLHWGIGSFGRGFGCKRNVQAFSNDFSNISGRNPFFSSRVKPLKARGSFLKCKPVNQGSIELARSGASVSFRRRYTPKRLFHGQYAREF